MKRIEYIIESPKVDEEKNIAICSDMHINEKTSEKKLDKVLETLYYIEPTHIVLPGDLYDVDRDDLWYLSERTSEFIDYATDIADVFYVKGNIEQKSGLLPYRLYNNNNPRFHLLCERNVDGKYRCINAGGINIAGIKLPPYFYKLSESEKARFLLARYQKYLEKLSKHCGSKDFNVLLCHDPMIIAALEYFSSLTDKSQDENSINFDLIISGHNHGGIWPEWMKPILKAKNANLELCYPTYTKGMYESSNDVKMVVSEGVTKFHSDFGSLQKLERFHEGTIENVKVLSSKK